MANIEFPDQLLDAFFKIMEGNPVPWSDDKKYAFQKKQKREEAWQRLILHLKEKFPDTNPHAFTCKYKFFNIFKFYYVLIMSVCV